QPQQPPQQQRGGKIFVGMRMAYEEAEAAPANQTVISIRDDSDDDDREVLDLSFVVGQTKRPISDIKLRAKRYKVDTEEEMNKLQKEELQVIDRLSKIRSRLSELRKVNKFMETIVNFK